MPEFQYSAQQITTHVWRLCCYNPGPMTGPGTNTYIIQKNHRFAVIDAGPINDNHLAAILTFTGGTERIDSVIVTHMHSDHSPLAVILAEQVGCDIVGGTPIDDPHQDTSCQPQCIIKHHEIIEFHGLSLKVIHTPGHVDNHFCFLLEDDQVLMTGDHIMQGSTVVIIPPHGKMKDYIESLQLLLDYPIKVLAPAHGEPITDVKNEIEYLINHRLRREATVVAAMQVLGSANTEDLTKEAYKDVNKSLHSIAELSLLAHLIKLEQEQRAVCTDNHWYLSH